MTKPIKKTETVEEFLARGGKVIKVLAGEEPPPQIVGSVRKNRKPVDQEDFRDGLLPNIRLIGGK